MSGCVTTYKECTEARQARVAKALAEAEPWETAAHLAEKAGVTTRTIRRAKAKRTPVLTQIGGRVWI